MSDQDIERRMRLFTRYLESGGMEKKDYQYDGVRWCLMNELRAHPSNTVDVRGGFFADEMGLGKTIQMIGLMVANMVRNTLIVVPPILVDQWNAQILRTTGHKSLVYSSATKRRITQGQLEQARVVITTYSMVAQHYPEYEENKIQQIKWARVIFDEAHHLRNQTIKQDSACMLQSECKWLVSGTPIQNRKRDFYGLCRVVGLPDWYYKNPEYLFTLANYYILKRTKKQVGVQLPPVHSKKHIVEWQSDKEKELSEAIHSALSFSKVSRDRGTQHAIVCAFDRHETQLPLFLRARQSCTIPRMMVKALDDLVSRGIVDTYDDHIDALQGNSKLSAVASAIASHKGNGMGKLVFCHFRDEMDDLALQLRIHGFDRVAVFDGRTKMAERYAILTAKYEVLLIQINTGCEGLNLQEHYSEVYFVSPHWNPSVEAQAIARLHRLGQKNVVRVNRFVMSCFDPSTTTIDKYARNVQHKKKDLVREMFTKFHQGNHVAIVPPEPQVVVADVLYHGPDGLHRGPHEVRYGQITHVPVMATATLVTLPVAFATVVQNEEFK